MNTERFTFGGVTLEVRGQDAWTVSKASARFHAEDGARSELVQALAVLSGTAGQAERERLARLQQEKGANK